MQTTHAPFLVNRIVPMVHVASVETSIAFYAKLGFGIVSVMKDPQAKAFWAFLSTAQGVPAPADNAACVSGPAELMLTLACEPVEVGKQGVLFYLYTTDLKGLKNHLSASNIPSGGAYSGNAGQTPWGTDGGKQVMFDITHPPYMPAGEFRLHDPDGYVLLIGQLG